MPELAGVYAAYLATAYRVDAPSGPVVIRIGSRHPAIDRLLRSYGADDWAFMTAANPRSVMYSRAANDAANAVLRERLRDAGMDFLEGQGVADDAGWLPEDSVWVPGLARAEALVWGRRCDQNAIVVGRLGGVAELLACVP